MEIGPKTPSKLPSSISILVIDDEKASAELAATLLRSQGFQVRTAGSGREGLAIVASGGIDLLIIDLMMAKLDGVEVCAHLRNELAEPFLPVIITTSLQDRESRIRAKEAGADDVLVKPLDGLELLVRVESLLRMRAVAASLKRDNERLREELAHVRTHVHAQQREARAAEAASEVLSELVEEQWRLVDQAKRRFAQHPAVQEQLQSFAEITIELRRSVGALAGTGTVTRMSEGTEALREVAEARRSSTRLLK